MALQASRRAQRPELRAQATNAEEAAVVPLTPLIEAISQLAEEAAKAGLHGLAQGAYARLGGRVVIDL